MRKWKWFLVSLPVLAILSGVYIRIHPLVFMESHKHCIKYAGLEFETYAQEHGGRFPFSVNGYGNALLLMNEDCFNCLTGPGYDAAPLLNARQAGHDLAEEECGRVYVQGLTKQSNPELALLFDKLPTPGGDHRAFPARMWAHLGREVWFVGSNMAFVRESEWPEFARKQVDLLVQEGFEREKAERLFASKPR